jgi:hypothetical protein
LTSLQSQVDLGKASTSQDRLERQLDILQVHQKQISDALNVMEAEAEHLSRWVHFHDRSRYSSPQTKLTFLAVRMFRRSPQHSAALDSQTSSSQETLYSLAESISAHLSSLGDALHGIVPSSTSAEEESNHATEASGSNTAFPSEVLQANLQTLHSIEQKIGHASAALR